MTFDDAPPHEATSPRPEDTFQRSPLASATGTPSAMSASSRTAPAEHTLGLTEGEQLLAFFKENLEAVAIAVVMALVIKFFCVEAFQIPTGSMSPTLLGETSEHNGDRILVDKWAYLLRDPQRWDVPVFRYPLNEARNFIKRLVGLPGEEFRIGPYGEIWVRDIEAHERERIDFEIARKPARVREQLYSPIYPSTHTPFALRSRSDFDFDQPKVRLPASTYWRKIGGNQNAWTFPALGDFEFAGGEEGGFENLYTITRTTTPTSWHLIGSSTSAVRDLRIHAAVEVDRAVEVASKNSLLAAPIQRFRIVWRPDERYETELVLHEKEGMSVLRIRRDDELYVDEKLAATLVPGAKLRLTLEYVDGDARLSLNGTEVAVVPDGRRVDDDVHPGNQQLAFYAQGRAMKLTNVRIGKDLVYGRNSGAYSSRFQHGLKIPEDSYFMLGDNTGASKDSRKWEMRYVRLRDGRLIEYEEEEYSNEADKDDPSIRWNVVTDRRGVQRRWMSKQEDPGTQSSGRRYAPFVHREHIVGRAFLKFWPLPKRLGFIH